jgi:ABC-2 type transport system permease protein
MLALAAHLNNPMHSQIDMACLQEHLMFRKLRTLITAQHALMLAYRAEIYLWVLATILPFIMMSVWMTAAGGGNGGTGFSMDPLGYARYFIAVFFTRQLTIVWMIYEFEWYVQEGRLSYLLLRPMNAIWHFVGAHLAEQLARAPFFLVVIGVFFCIYPGALWLPSVASIVLGLAAVYGAFALRFSIAYCLSMLTFHFERASSLENLSMLPYLFFSGIIIPLSDLPPRVREVVALTPFPYMVDFPARILTGKIGPGDAGLYQGFGIMACWFAAFALLGSRLWRWGLREYSGQGA